MPIFPLFLGTKVLIVLPMMKADTTNIPDIPDVLRTIQKFRTDNGLSYRRLAILAGINITTLRSMRRENWNPTADTMDALLSLVKRTNATRENVPQPKGENNAGNR